MSKVPSGRRCESDEGSGDGLGHEGGPGKASDSPEQVLESLPTAPMESQVSVTVMIILLEQVSRGKRVDPRFCRE